MKTLSHFVLWNLGLACAETQTSEAERACLARHASGRRRLVEIGVWHGVTTKRLNTAMAKEGVLYAIDPFQPGRLHFSMQRIIAHREVKRVKGGKIRWIRMNSSAAAKRIGDAGPFDFVFIDGDHTWDGIAEDWSAWSSLVSARGLITLHDSVSSGDRLIDDAGSARFTREVVASDPRFALLETVDTLTVWERKLELPDPSA